MSTDLERPELERRPHLALAAKLLVALGVAVLFLLVRGQSADAVEAPAGPLEQVERATGVPAREVVRETTGTVRGAAAPAVEISAPEAPDAARPARVIERSVRVLPQADETEAIRLDLHLDDDQLDVAVTPPTPGTAHPIRLQLPSLLDGLPSIEVAVVDGASAAAAHPVSNDPVRATPVVAAPGTDTVAPAATTERSTRPEPSATVPAERAPRVPVPEGSPSPLPTGVASAAGAILAVLGVLDRRAAAQPSSIVHAAHGRVPVAPAIRPSFTPD